jgi:hypothetical protein
MALNKIVAYERCVTTGQVGRDAKAILHGPKNLLIDVFNLDGKTGIYHPFDPSRAAATSWRLSDLHKGCSLRNCGTCHKQS